MASDGSFPIPLLLDRGIWIKLASQRVAIASSAYQAAIPRVYPLGR
jgi:hypothetical protein